MSTFGLEQKAIQQSARDLARSFPGGSVDDLFGVPVVYVPMAAGATFAPRATPPTRASGGPKSLGADAWQTGYQVGCRYSGDPVALARELGIKVHTVSATEMGPSSKPGMRTVGYYQSSRDGEPARIFLLRGRPRADELRTLAHEICHHLHPDADHENVYLWAKGFRFAATP